MSIIVYAEISISNNLVNANPLSNIFFHYTFGLNLRIQVLGSGSGWVLSGPDLCVLEIKTHMVPMIFRSVPGGGLPGRFLSSRVYSGGYFAGPGVFV